MLALATDAEPPPPAAGPASPGRADPGSAAAANVRRHAVAVMDAVDRSGVVAPWTSIPHLIALTTDPNACAAPRALSSALLSSTPCWVNKCRSRVCARSLN